MRYAVLFVVFLFWLLGKVCALEFQAQEAPAQMFGAAYRWAFTGPLKKDCRIEVWVEHASGKELCRWKAALRAPVIKGHLQLGVYTDSHNKTHFALHVACEETETMGSETLQHAIVQTKDPNWDLVVLLRKQVVERDHDYLLARSLDMKAVRKFDESGTTVVVQATDSSQTSEAKTTTSEGYSVKMRLSLRKEDGPAKEKR